mmetsp:Transcript_19294/g.34404  ORF Transcript_19294/g.34404 Transcript_19294/m.34404 type:complete len:636 (-) Transcript_19294:64-1971(-)
MGVISLQMISKEVMLVARQLGQVVSETLAALVAATVINRSVGSFYVERPIDENDARLVVEEAAKILLSKEEPGISCLRLQAAYESSFADVEGQAQKQKSEAKEAEDGVIKWISNFTAKFDQDFNTLTGLYKKIYTYLLLKCTGPIGVATPPKDPVIEREVAAALESVFPRVGLRSFVALTGPEKAAQLQELAGIILGIRLFNKKQQKGGAGLQDIDEVTENLKSEDLIQLVQKEVDEENDLSKMYVDLIAAAKNPPRSGPWDKPPDEGDIHRARSDLLYHRQYLCYLLNLQEDLARSLEQLAKDSQTLKEELVDLEGLVGGRVSVPKEQVYPRFDAVARTYRAAWQEVKALEARKKLHTVLSDLRKQYFPRPSQALQDLVVRYRESATDEADDEDPVDLDLLPGPQTSPGPGADTTFRAVRLTVENAPGFLQLPLDFQGFCIYSLVMQDRLLVPGNPALGVIKYAGRYCVFASERGCADFCADPDKFFGGVREVCYKYPELIHLLRIHEDFPKSSLHSIIQLTSSSQAAMMADVQTETPVHFVEENIDKSYEFNEWKMRREALHMADIKRKQTSATQTALSHLRRENETQVYLPKEVGTNTTVERGTNPTRWAKYTAGVRGEPQPMKVVQAKFDL